MQKIPENFKKYLVLGIVIFAILLIPIFLKKNFYQPKLPDNISVKTPSYGENDFKFNAILSDTSDLTETSSTETSTEKSTEYLTEEQPTENLTGSTEKKTDKTAETATETPTEKFTENLPAKSDELKHETDTKFSSERYDTYKYQEILDEYTDKLRNATPLLINEYEQESKNSSNDIYSLATIMRNKAEQLAKISNEGTQKMAEYYHKISGDYSEYEEWTKKLYSVYEEEYQKIYAEYNNSVIN